MKAKPKTIIKLLVAKMVNMFSNVLIVNHREKGYNIIETI